MTIERRLRKQRGETERHYLARKIFLPYLEVKKRELEGSKIYFEFPPYGGRARADLALIIEKPPIALVEIWVEVQDTRLSEKGWKNKLLRISERFKPGDIYIAITENLSSDIFSILDVVSKYLKKYKFFLVDTRKEMIYNFVLKNGIETYKIKISKSKILKKKLEISLDRFFG